MYNTKDANDNLQDIYDIDGHQDLDYYNLNLEEFEQQMRQYIVKIRLHEKDVGSIFVQTVNLITQFRKIYYHIYKNLYDSTITAKLKNNKKDYPAINNSKISYSKIKNNINIIAKKLRFKEPKRCMILKTIIKNYLKKEKLVNLLS